MLTRLTIRNFKRFGQVEIELGNPVVFIGPNNSGKNLGHAGTGPLGYRTQALERETVGEEYAGEAPGGHRQPSRSDCRSRPGCQSPVARPARAGRAQVEGRQQTSNVRIDIIVEGVTKDRSWTCGLEFDYANEESFYCRPLRRAEGKTPIACRFPRKPKPFRLPSFPPCPGLPPRRRGSTRERSTCALGRDAPPMCCATSATRSEEKPELWTELGGEDHGPRSFGSKLASPRTWPSVARF